MRVLRSLLTLFLLLLAPVLHATPAMAEERHMLAQLVPESDTPAAGTRTTLGVVMTPQPGWHGYWKLPGDTGLPDRFGWALPKGVTAGDAAYPTPSTLVIAGLMNHVYEAPYALLVPVDIAPGLAKGTALPVKLKLDYLVCSAELCVPETADLATTLTVGDGAIDPAARSRFDRWRKALPRPLGTEGHYQVAGGKLRVAVPLPAAVKLGGVHLFPTADGALVYAAPQSFSRDGDTLVIETAMPPGGAKPFDALLATGDGTGLTLHATPGAVPAAGEGATTAGKGTLALTVLALGGAVLGGLILNIMPCVFPILSLKALSLARAGGEEKTVRREALAYAGGVILVCVALGGLILGLRAAGTQVGWAFQLQSPGVILGLLLLTAAIGLNLAGLFELGAVTAGSGLAAKGGTAGAFWTGALAAFVATPCTGPFMAAALGAALVLPVAAALLVFAGLGLGLALPFLALGYVPALRRALPRPGAWMETFRHVLAVPMLLTALGVAWVLGRQAGADAVIAALGGVLLLGIGLWITGLRQRGFKPAAWAPAIVGLVAAIGLAAATPLKPPAAAAVAETGHVPFDATKLASLRAAGKPVFLYFTADWCLSCKVNEKASIERAETQQAFAKAGVTTMIGDWTDGDAAIGRFLEAHHRSGVPLYLWYAPDKEAQELPQVLTPGLLAGLARER